MIVVVRIDLGTDEGALLEVAAVTRSGPGQVQSTTLTPGRAEQLVRQILEYLGRDSPELTPPRRRLYHNPFRKGGAA